MKAAGLLYGWGIVCDSIDRIEENDIFEIIFLYVCGKLKYLAELYQNVNRLFMKAKIVLKLENSA